MPCRPTGSTILTPDQRRAYLIADNRLAEDAGWDRTILAEEFEALAQIGFDVALTGFERAEIDAILAGAGNLVAEIDEAEADGEEAEPSEATPAAASRGTLAARFGVPPFSVIKAREGWWQERKRAWIALGIRSVLLARGTVPVIPNNPTGRQHHPFDHSAWRKRNLIERLFCRLKDFPRIAKRYDRRRDVFLSAIYLAATVICWL